jgi:hypothetical protein
MTEASVRTRRNFPAETWAVIRDAYLGGETAESISRRLNISVNTIRKRASRCGWTHKAHGAAIARRGEEGAPPPDPAAAHAGALARAAELIGEGRAVEATALLKAAETLSRLAEPEAAPRAPVSEEQAREVQDLFWAQVWEGALRIAEHLLEEDATAVPSALSGPLFRWRAERLGPEIARADFQAAVAGGWAGRYWDEDGALRPAPPAREPSAIMQAQHARQCAWREERDMGIAEG